VGTGRETRESGPRPPLRNLGGPLGLACSRLQATLIASARDTNEPRTWLHLPSSAIFGGRWGASSISKRQHQIPHRWTAHSSSPRRKHEAARGSFRCCPGAANRLPPRSYGPWRRNAPGSVSSCPASVPPARPRPSKHRAPQRSAGEGQHPSPGSGQTICGRPSSDESCSRHHYCRYLQPASARANA
jgi:hypothetical protein